MSLFEAVILMLVQFLVRKWVFMSGLENEFRNYLILTTAQVITNYFAEEPVDILHEWKSERIWLRPYFLC